MSENGLCYQERDMTTKLLVQIVNLYDAKKNYHVNTQFFTPVSCKNRCPVYTGHLIPFHHPILMLFWGPFHYIWSPRDPQ